jgi:hypothetical protein
MLALAKYSNLLGPSVSYEEYVLWIKAPELYSEHFIFFVSYD